MSRKFRNAQVVADSERRKGLAIGVDMQEARVWLIGGQDRLGTLGASTRGQWSSPLRTIVYFIRVSCQLSPSAERHRRLHPHHFFRVAFKPVESISAPRCLSALSISDHLLTSLYQDLSQMLWRSTHRRRRSEVETCHLKLSAG